ncbi:MAG: alpha-E domain-containing protein [SAR86 cluster bacterium]|nr:alpha-E domain-containing protein [SAR86 cluster bacterium]
MLSRDAEHLYWLSRYVERVENIARLINVNAELMLDFPGDKTLGWKSLIDTLDTLEIYERKYVTFKEANVINFLSSEMKNPNSIKNCLIKASYNVKETRDYLPPASTEQINNLLNEFNLSQSKLLRNNAKDLYKLIEGSQRFFGIINDNFSNGFVYEFIRLGRYIERVDMVSRTLDTLTVSKKESQTHDFATLEWASLLRNLSAYAAYRDEAKGEIVRANVIKFLFKNKGFPRSINTCLREIDRGVAALPNNKLLKQEVYKLIERVSYSRIENYDDDQLHHFLDSFQKKVNHFDQRIHKSWFQLHG